MRGETRVYTIANMGNTIFPEPRYDLVERTGHTTTPRTKRDFYRRWVRGEFGNRIRVWHHPDEVTDCNRLVIRSQVPGSSHCKYDLALCDIRKWWDRFLSLGQDPIINEAMPAEYVVFQGEVCLGVRGMEITYSTEPLHMRPALAKNTQHATGLRATAMLQHHLDPSSYEDIAYFLESYHDAVVEFTTLRCNIGDIPHRNTVFWEVRGY